MNRKIATLVVLLLGTMLLAGCGNFAMEEDRSVQNDVLVGVSLRIYDPGEPDGMDEEGNYYWYADEDEAAENVYESWSEGDTTHTDGGAELTEEEFKRLLGGSMEHSSGEYPIGQYYWYFYERVDELGICNGSECNWPGSAKMHITVNDEGEEYALTAEVYLCGSRFAQTPFISIHLEPIYQKADGTLYCRRELNGVSAQISGFSQTVSEESSIKAVDGSIVRYRTEISVSFVQVPALESAVIYAFDAQHQVLSCETLVPQADESGAWRCEYTPPEGAAYLLLEEHCTDEQGDADIRYTSANLTSAAEYLALFTVYLPNEDGLAMPCNVYLPQE